MIFFLSPSGGYSRAFPCRQCGGRLVGRLEHCLSVCPALTWCSWSFPEQSIQCLEGDLNHASFLLGSGGSLYTYIVNESMILNGVGMFFGEGSRTFRYRILVRCNNNMIQ